jgi:hypothetical protein
VPKLRRALANSLVSLFAVACITACGTPTTGTPTSGWDLGDAVVVADNLPGGGLTSLASDGESLYFNMYNGPLNKTPLAGGPLSVALGQPATFDNRYEIQFDGSGSIYWTNGLFGGGNPGRIIQTSLASQLDEWTVSNLNGPASLAVAAGYLYFFNSYPAHEIRRVSLDGNVQETVYASADTLTGLTVAPNGDLYFGRWPNQAARWFVSFLASGQTTPVDLAYFDGKGIDHTRLLNDVLYVDSPALRQFDTAEIYSVNLSNHAISDVASPGLYGAISTQSQPWGFSVDNDGMYWATSGYQIFACYLDGSHVTLVAYGTNFLKRVTRCTGTTTIECFVE